MKLKRISPLIPFLFLFVFFCLLIQQVLLHCHSYYDLGIYSDALRYLSLSNWNPFIPGRNIFIFNDHFDPILIPMSYFSTWVPPPFLGMSLEFLSIAACWFPIQALIHRQKISLDLGVFSYAFLILNQASVDALLTPFHPTTWAVFPLVCVFCFYILERYWAVLVFLIVLFACREEFPLVGITLGTLLIWDQFLKNKKGLDGKGVVILAVSFAWTFFAFGLRSKVFPGEHSQYGKVILEQFFSDPGDTILKYWSMGFLRMFLVRCVPIFLLLDYIKLRKEWGTIFRFLWIGSPILAIRFISAQWAFHYGTAAVIVFYFMFFSTLAKSTPSRLRLGFAYGVLAIGFFGPLAQKFQLVFFDPPISRETPKRCTTDKMRLKEIEKAQTWVALSGKKKILLENHLAVTQMLASRRLGAGDQSIFIVGGLSSAKVGPFDVVLVEKPSWGDPWPVGMVRLKELIEFWSHQPDLELITDNEQVFLAVGKIEVDR